MSENPRSKIHECFIQINQRNPILEHTPEQVPELTKSLREASYHVKQLMLVFTIELDSDEPSLPLSKNFITEEAGSISNKIADFVPDPSQNQALVAIPDSLLAQVEIFQILQSIISFNNRFIASNSLAANSWLKKSAQDSQAMVLNDKTFQISTLNANEFQHHLLASANHTDYVVNYRAINLQLEKIAQYLQHLSKDIDANDPMAYFSDQDKKKNFKKCLGLIQFMIRLVKISWAEYKTNCRKNGVPINSKIMNVVNTALNNFLTKFVFYDFPKAAGIEIPQTVLDKYERPLEPELEALSPEERTDPNKVAQAQNLITARHRQERRNKKLESKTPIIENN
jgi:hypothetical protein